MNPNHVNQLKEKIAQKKRQLEKVQKFYQRKQLKLQRSQERQIVDQQDLPDDQENLLKQIQRAAYQLHKLQHELVCQHNQSPIPAYRQTTTQQQYGQSQNIKRARPIEQNNEQKPIKKVKRNLPHQRPTNNNHQNSQHFHLLDTNNNNEQKQQQVHRQIHQQQRDGSNQDIRQFVQQEQNNDDHRQDNELPQQPVHQASLQTAYFNIPNEQRDIESDSPPSSSSSSSSSNYSSQEQDEHHDLSSSEYSSQQKYTIHDSLLYCEFSQNMQNHPRGYEMSLFPKHITYSKYTEKKRDSIFDSRKILIPDEAHYLDHRNVPVDIQRFVRYNWINLIEISFVNCKLTNEQFQRFAEYYRNYQYIKILYLSCNKQFTTVTEAMLSNFTKLEYINFGKDYDTCFLSSQSIRQLQNYQESHQKVTVIYYKR